MILDAFQEQQDEYNAIKRDLKEREEDRLAKLEERERKERLGDGNINNESKVEEDDDVLCEDDPDLHDDDITISIASGYWRGPSSVTSASGSPDRQRNSALASAADPADSGVASSSLFMPALSFFFSTTGEEPPVNDVGET